MLTKKTETALLIDANALLHRAWHALPPMTSPDGKLVNAVYGFTSVLINIVQRLHPDHLVACWDTAAPTFRHQAEPEYKAQREEQPQEFYDQAPLIKEIFKSFGGLNVEKDGFEADDLLGTFAVRLAREGVDVTVLTSDRDVWQLIGPRIKILAFKKGVSETVTYDEEMLKQVTGLRPEQVAAWKALRGDASDNLKGVPGIGEKTATDLILAYTDLDGVFEAAHDPQSALKPGVRQKLLAGEHLAKAVYPLVQIVTDVPLEPSQEATLRKEADEEEVRRLFMALGFKTLLVRALGMKGEEKKTDDKKRATVKAQTKEVEIRKVMEVKQAEEMVKEIGEMGEVFIHTHEAQQASLFADKPELALATTRCIYLIHKSLLDNVKAKELVAAILKNDKIIKHGHGLKGLWHWSRERGMDLRGLGLDTEIASYLLAAGEGGHDLEALAATRLGRVLAEGEDSIVKEIEVVMDLHKTLESELKETVLEPVYRKIEAPLIPLLGKMEEKGIMIDTEYFKELTVTFRKEKEKLEKEMQVLAGEEFNPASPSQLAHVLFEVLDLPVKGIKRGKTGISTAAAELDKLAGTHPIIEKIGAFRETSKLLSTYVEVMPQLADEAGRVHTTFNQAVTATGRLSSTEPNLQNIPIRTELGRKIRRGFVAPKGSVLLSCDYSQIELRIVAALAKDKKMLDAFARGADIHTSTAAAIWHVAEEEVTKDQRRAAKAVNFGIIYGQGPVGLARSADIGFEEAKHFIEEYFVVYSGIHEYLEQTKALARARGYVETLYGRRRPLPEINSPRPELRAAAERMAINMPVQGTAADIMKLAMLEVGRGLDKATKGAILLQVHDELVFEVPEEELAEAAKYACETMESAVKLECPLKVDAKAGLNWEEMKPVK